MSQRTLADLRERYGPRYRWLLLGAVMSGNVAWIMSSTLASVAIPDISRHFRVAQEQVQWVSSGFMIAMTVGMLLMPWLLSRLGYRRLYTACGGLLLAASLAGGLTDDFTVLLVSRVAQGLAAGAVQPVPTLIILLAFDRQEQGRATGLYGMGVVLAPALGPSAGGVLVHWFGWRSIFFVVVPFSLACLALVQRFVPDAESGADAPARRAFDWPGLLLGAGGTVLVLNGLAQLRSHALGALLIALGAAALGAFVAWQRRLLARGGAPLMNTAVFGSRTFAISAVVAFVYGGALFGSTYLLPVFMQLGLGLSPAAVGAILLLPGAMLAVSLVAAGRMADRHPTHLLVITGLLLLAGSLALCATVGLGSSLWLLVAWTVLGRMGLGFILPSLNLGALRSLDKPLAPPGASAINFMRMLGGVSGVSLCALALEWRLAAHGESLDQAATSAARVAAFNETFLLLALACTVALAAAWQLRQRPQ